MDKLRFEEAKPMIDLLIANGYEAYWEGSGACGGSDPALATEGNPHGHWHPGDVRVRNLTMKHVRKMTRKR